jgi:hypothetical protein
MYNKVGERGGQREKAKQKVEMKLKTVLRG